jgi:NADPH2:quinone reductase
MLKLLCLPLTTLTAWELLFDRLAAQDDTSKSILVIGAAGVGSILVQLAKKLTKLTFIATASREVTQPAVKGTGSRYSY